MKIFRIEQHMVSKSISVFANGGTRKCSPKAPMQGRKVWSICWRFMLAGLLALPLAGCLEEEKVPLSYLALNKTDKWIVSIVVNGEGGILDVSPMGGGGKIVCCVVLPKRWRPGLMATIKWQEDDIPVFDASGKRLLKNGMPVVTKSPWKERTVEVPKYPESMGDFYIVFFPGDEIKVAVSNGRPAWAKKSQASNASER